MGAAVRTLGLTKKYGKLTAVDNLNMEVLEGEIFGLLGPNGAGKTTTLLMLTTVIKPTSGTAIVGGYDVVKEPDKVRRLVGIAFQEPRLYWVDTAWDTLLWHAKVCGFSGQRAKEEVESVLKFLDAWDERRKVAHELSGGTKKRIEVAKLLIQKPKIAIFDEPTAQVDVAGKHKIWSAIRAMRDEGATVIVATNDLHEADVLSDRVGIMFGGRLVTHGTPAELKDRIPGGDIVEMVFDLEVPDSLIEAIRAVPLVARVIKARGSVIKVYLNEAEKALPRILTAVTKAGLEPTSVSVREPTLDDVFFHFTGLTASEAERGAQER